MTVVRFYLLMSVVALAIALPGCRDGQVRPDPGLVTPSTGNSVGMGALGPLDVLEVRVFDEKELTGKYRVDADGSLTFPFIGAVQVEGKTPSEVAALIRDALADGYIVDPAVTVTVAEANSREVVVIGYVKNPGNYPFRDGMTIVEAIALAGGVDQDGGPRRTSVTRNVNGEMISFLVDVPRVTAGKDPNVPLLPNDIINIPESAI